MPGTEDILSEIEAIEQEATSFILNGGLELPDDVEVAATGPVELVELNLLNNPQLRKLQLQQHKVQQQERQQQLNRQL